MDIAALKRNAAAIHNNWKELPDDSVITMKGCTIHIPSRYIDKGLAVIGNETYIVGYFAVVDFEGNYGVSSAATMLRINPITQSKYIYLGEEYIQFEFPPGSTVLPDVQAVMQGTLLYNIYAAFIGGGLIPWFMDYELDVLNLFETDVLHSGTRLAANRAIFHMVAATITRYHKDRTKYYRQALERKSDIKTIRPDYVPFKSVIYGPKSTSAKLSGNYFDQAVATALVNQAEGRDEIEVLLRS